MSASPYTKGRLKVAYGSAWVEEPNDAEVRVSVLLADRNSHSTTPTERDANVRRAVACWNAMEGVSTEDIERHITTFLGALAFAVLRK